MHWVRLGCRKYSTLFSRVSSGSEIRTNGMKPYDPVSPVSGTYTPDSQPAPAPPGQRSSSVCMYTTVLRHKEGRFVACESPLRRPPKA